ncbi:NAD-dependent epimerase/dehydratase family protein [Pedobacter petrophilus]|uniref:GDP-L-fucose synthase n=2 Tax=Pedobacter petrophilus TaxID=1908241 RepID=A0A7K0G4Q8_9SPHI|nr:GDP-L-fucose synthase [Pedobacter petrophilus]MRX78344.1 NAD-dependent epimerase/dehydratase family protein [Pedobacter petrophilus]
MEQTDLKDLDAKIYVAGHKGMVGSAIERALIKQGYTNIIKRTSKQLDLTDKLEVDHFFATYKPDYVFLAAAKVGGIMANNTYPADFLVQNINIQTNVIHASMVNKVKKLLFLGSSCIYPKLAPQPIKEEYLLTGALEATNDAYAIAKICGIKMCQAYARQYGVNYINAMPTNLYGKNDNYHLENSHVLPALIRKIHEAKHAGTPEVTVWGTGTPKREFLYADDLAEACVHLMKVYNSSEIVNIGTGEDLTIKELATTISKTLEYDGNLIFDVSKPDGTPRKLLDVSRIKNTGWEPKVELEKGVFLAYQDYLEQIDYPKIAVDSKSLCA